MDKGKGRRNGYPFTIAALLFAGLLSGCGRGGPAPVVSGGIGPPPLTITVRHGQTLSGIARAYHVSMQTLAEANRLSPPYRIIAGGVLIIPGGGAVVAGGFAAKGESGSGPGPIAETGSSAAPPPRSSVAALSPPPGQSGAGAAGGSDQAGGAGQIGGRTGRQSPRCCGRAGNPARPRTSGPGGQPRCGAAIG